MRALTSAPVRLVLQTTDQGGDLVTPDQAPRYVLTDLRGVQLADGAYQLDEDRWTAQVSLASADLGLVDVASTWEVGGDPHYQDDTLELVGSRLVPMARLRQVLDQERAELGLGALSAEVAALTLERVEDLFRQALGWSPYLAGGRFYAQTSAGQRKVRLPGARHLGGVVYADHTGGDLSPEDFTLSQHELRAEAGLPQGELMVDVVHGASAPPQDLVRAAERYAAHLARRNDLPERATEVTTDGAIFALALASPNAPTGLPEVDSTLLRYRLRSWVA